MNILIPIIVLGVMGAAFGILLGVAAKAFRVKKDERIDQIGELLAGANCGGCGYPGCGGFAEALCQGVANITDCPSTKPENREKIGEILGVQVGESVPMVAMVMCSGTCSNVVLNHHYEGINDCVAAARYGGSDKACPYGCIGFGSCADVCQFGAITIENDIAVIDRDKCVACGACVNICPHHVIKLVEKKQRTFVKCVSKDKGAALKNICSAGCIGCKICEKNCEAGAITVVNNHAVIDYSKCTACGICAEKCPKKIILPVLKEENAVEECNDQN